MKKINLKHIHSLNEEALRGLDFYEEEIRILQERLEDVAKENYDKEAMLKVEHFQNQLIIQRDNIDDLRHAIRRHLSVIKEQLEKSSEYISENADQEETTLYEQYLELEKTINALRHEFNHFAAEWI
ncbi:hypothetical protein [Arcticibacter sp.]|uniref:hypothetical protein n=1 Tax=Arcticibacter sp. TaxID=1872630 RepID=UPI00388E61E5